MDQYSWSLLLFLRDCLLGGLAGAVSKTVVAPLERIKLILQVQDASKQMTYHDNKKYEGMVDCSKRILKEQGIASFWRGNWANVIRYFPLQAINLACKERYKKIFMMEGLDKDKDFWLFFAGNMLSGAATGATSSVAVYPLDFARTRLAADVGRVPAEREFLGLWDCIKKIFQSDGFSGLYKGLLVSILGSSVYRSVHFGLYDTAKGLIEQDGFFLNWSISQATVILATILVYPLDTVRRRMMMQSGYNKTEAIYTSTAHCISSIIQDEGCTAFFKGVTANILRGISSALVLVVYEEVQKYLK